MGPNCTSATATFLPLPSRGSNSKRPAPRVRDKAAVFWPCGRRGPPDNSGDAAGLGASSASSLSEMWMLGAQPMLAAAPRTRWQVAAIRSANGPPGASGPPRAPCHRRLGGRRRARISRQEARPPLLSRCGRCGGGGGGKGALRRVACHGRPSEHALTEAGAAGRLPHIAALASAALPGKYGGGDLRSPYPGAAESTPREPRRPRRAAARPPGEASSRPRPAPLPLPPPPPPPRLQTPPSFGHPRRSARWAADSRKSSPGQAPVGHKASLRCSRWPGLRRGVLGKPLRAAGPRPPG